MWPASARHSLPPSPSSICTACSAPRSPPCGATRVHWKWNCAPSPKAIPSRSEEHTSELQSLMRISYAVFCLKKKTTTNKNNYTDIARNSKQRDKSTTNNQLKQQKQY